MKRSNSIERNYYISLVQDDYIRKAYVIYNYAGEPVGMVQFEHWQRKTEPDYYSLWKSISRERIKAIFPRIIAHSYSDLIDIRRGKRVDTK